MRLNVLLLTGAMIISQVLSGMNYYLNDLTTFQDVLNEAASNGENDTIFIEAGTFVVESTYQYASAEDHSLSIIGDVMMNTKLDGASSVQILHVSATFPQAHVMLRNLVFQNGMSTENGGGILLDGDAANINMEHCHFLNNEAGNLGGGLNGGTNSGQITLENCLFQGNSSGNDGGGLNLGSESGTINLVNCEFLANMASGDDAGGAFLYMGGDNGVINAGNNYFEGNESADDGGGLMLYYLGANVEANVTENSFVNNVAGLNGGGSYLRITSSGTVNFSDNSYNGNLCNTGNGGGCHIELHNVDMAFQENSFVSNAVENDGAGAFIEHFDGSLDCHHNTFTQNIANRNGGAIHIYSEQGSVLFYRNITDSNLAENVGGAFNVASTTGSFSIYHNTFYGDQALNDGGTIYFYGESGALATVYNSVFWSQSLPAIAFSGGIAVGMTYCDVEGGNGQPWFGTGCIEDDPLFVDAVAGDFHLTELSPCIDSGDPESPPDPDGTPADMGALSFDQSGQAIEQTMELGTGYQFVSTYVIPNEPEMMMVVEELLESSLGFIRNTEGSMFQKIGPNWVNGIGDWNALEGYLFYMNEADMLTVEGEQIDYQTPIMLSSGYQFISYLPDEPVDAIMALENILNENLNFVRDSEGSMLHKIGPNWVNNIGNLNPGEGYLIKMNNPDELIYNVD
ncbi:MAG: hypothetical protein K9I94_06945 [Bacteroidales bacterium]|nr:hypothetical protein [Bacteroidales bacterium]